MSYTIKSTTGKALYVAKGAADVRAALEEASKVGAYLADANLADAYLADVNLARAYLARAYLAGANLAGANLARANLDGAYLARANLADAYLARANLAGANLDGANLARANFDGAQWQGVAVMLRAAIESMNDSGRHWIKGSISHPLEDGSLAYCAIGSVEAQHKVDGTTRVLALWLLGSVCAGDIARFNDDPVTTWADVQAVFAVAIRHAERLAAR